MVNPNMEGGLLAWSAIDRARVKTKSLGFLVPIISSNLENSSHYFYGSLFINFHIFFLILINLMWLIYNRLKVKATQLQLGNYSHSLSLLPCFSSSFSSPSLPFSVSFSLVFSLSNWILLAIQNNANLREKSFSVPDPGSYLLQVL